jgi:hypothetical protein
MDTFGPINAGIVNRANNKARVIDLPTYRTNREAGFGKGISQRAATHDSPELIKHEDEAIALGNSWKKPTMGERLNKGMQFLGLTE